MQALQFAVQLVHDGFPVLLRQAAGRQGADDLYAIDIGLVVGRLDVIDIGALFGVRVSAEAGGIGEAQEQAGWLRFLDGDGQAAAGVLFAGQDVEANPVPFDQGDAIVDDGSAEIELAQQVVGVALNDGATLQARQERGGILDAVEQALPDLVTAQGFEQRVLQIVDLDEVFEIHGPMLASHPCNSNESSRNMASARARAAGAGSITSGSRLTASF